MKARLVFPLSLLLTLSAAAAGVFTGSVDIAPEAVVRALLSADAPADTTWLIVCGSRLPQVLTAALSGAALAVAGLLTQTVFANPLADPSLLGINAGASLGTAVAMLLFGGTASLGALTLSGYLLTVSAALTGALAFTLLLVALASLLRGRLALLITGLMMSYLASSVISLLTMRATAQGLRSYAVWGLGDFSGVAPERLPAYALTIAFGLAVALRCAKPLNALLLGEHYAANLGVRVRLVRPVLLATVGLLSAAVTALCGPIAFIGLAVPHGVRLLLRTEDHRLLLPATALWGACIALLCNVLSHLPADGTVLPVNTLTPLVGVPAVLYVLLRRPA